MPEGGVEVTVDGLEDGFRPPRVRVCKGAAPWHEAYAQVRQLACLGKHRVRNLAQGVEAPDDRIQHYHQVLPCIKVLDVSLAAILAADPEDFLPVEQIYHLTVYRLSDKMCTFVHRYWVLW